MHCIVSPQSSHVEILTLVLQSVTLFGDEVLTEVINLK